ncbi:MAG: PilC/PilY family type IV pilus protein, partial [Gammaproteobacteria bacterium]
TDAAGDSCQGVGLSNAGPLGVTIRHVYNNSDNVRGTCEDASINVNRGVIKRDWRVLSSAVNVLYYDPAENYEPWPGLPNANFRQARSHPHPDLPGYALTRDLAGSGGFQYIVPVDSAGFSGSRPGAGGYVAGANGHVDLWDDHVVVTVTANAIRAERIEYKGPFSVCSGSAHLESPPYKSCMGASVSPVSLTDVLGGRTPDAVRQNIANWYQYHRRRAFVPPMAVASVVRSVPSIRYGASMINNYGNLFVPFPGPNDNFSQHNSDLLQRTYRYPQQLFGTPLRPALARVGEYFSGQLPGFANPYTSRCQQSFALLLTDGYWNVGEPGALINDNDGDGYAKTLADVAHYYYNHDLSSLPDDVPVDSRCDASAPNAVCDNKTTQHMVTFTLAFGVEGRLTDTDRDGWPNPFLREAGNWGDPLNVRPSKIDDLWHAAYNSRGAFISARTPAEVRSGLFKAINSITSRTNSATSVTVNAGSISTDTLIFAASYNAESWSGELKAFNVDPSTGVPKQTLWTAQQQLDQLDFNQRVVLTARSDTGRGIPFRWPTDPLSVDADEMSTEQVNALLVNREAQDLSDYGEALVNYLRGDRQFESSNAGVLPEQIGFRVRTHVLADVVNSDPLYVGAPGRRYPDNWGVGAAENAKPYSEYKRIARTPMVYMGSNGGMLHGFQATPGGDGGKELLAYVPAGIFDRLSSLAQPWYAHKFFVDGPPVAEDVYFSQQSNGQASGWRTVLVGGLGAGGQSIYALDVTDPDRFSESRAKDIVLWEFTDPDLGFTFGKPAIGRLANGRWAVVFGSGVNNTHGDGLASLSGDAVLFVVDIETGTLIKKFNTQVGVNEDPLAEGRPNGLWTPALVDANGDFIVDSVFAGDLFGNLWKWDLTDTNPDNWHFAPSSGAPLPLFTARNANGHVQAITSRPEVGFHPDGVGLIAYFGTGKFFEVNDSVNTNIGVQSFYAIWDKTTTTVSRSALQQQVIEAEVKGVGDLDLRKTSSHPIDWTSRQGWFLDLVEPGKPDSGRGERVVRGPILRSGKVIFPTLLPASDECSGGGSGWLMELSAHDGARLEKPVMDVNNDGVITAADRLPGNANLVAFPSGVRSVNGGVPSQPAIVLESARSEKKYVGQSSGTVLTITEDPGNKRFGRQSWRKVR